MQRKNTQIFIQSQFSILRMELEEIPTSRLQTEDSLTQTSNTESIDKHSKHLLEAIIRSHSTLRSVIWVKLKCIDPEEIVLLKILSQELRIS